MKPKTLKITYWIVTIIFCLANLASGVAELFPSPMNTEILTLLGYPAYFFIILGIAKILGAIAIIQTKFVAVKEWAYAGFAIDYISASASFYFVNKDPLGMGVPFVFLAVMFVSYGLWKKVDKIK